MGTGSGPGWRPAGEAEGRLGSGPGRVAIVVAAGARPLEEGPIIAQPRLVIGAELAGEAVIKVLIERGAGWPERWSRASWQLARQRAAASSASR